MLHSRCVASDEIMFAIVVSAWREVHEVLLLGVEQLEEEAALVRVAEVPRHVERRPRLQSCPNITCKTAIRLRIVLQMVEQRET